MARPKSRPAYGSTKIYGTDHKAIGTIAKRLGVHRVQVLAAACELFQQLDRSSQVAAIQEAERQRMLSPAHAA